MCRQDLGVSQNLPLWSQTISVSLSKQGFPSLQWKTASHLNPLEAHEEKLDVFLNGYLSLTERYRLLRLMLPSFRGQLSEWCSCFSLSMKTFCWTAVTLRMREFQDLPVDSLLTLWDKFTLCTHSSFHPRLTRVEILFWCFPQMGFILSLNHSVNINMDNISQCYFNTSVTILSILSPLKEGYFHIYQCKMQLKIVIIRMQIKRYSLQYMYTSSYWMKSK